MIKAFIGEDGAAREDKLTQALKAWLGKSFDDPYSRENINVADGDSDEPLSQKLFRLCASDSLFAEKKAVVLSHAEKLTVNQQKDLLAYLKKPNEDAALFIIGEKLDGRSDLGKFLSKSGALEACDKLKDYQVAGWIRTTAKQKFNKDISPADAETLYQLTGNDPELILLELKKLRDYAPDDKAILPAHIQAVTSSQRAVTLFELQDAFGRRDPSAFFTCLRNALEFEEHPIRITLMIFSHIQRLYLIRELLDNGVQAKEIARQLKIHEYVFTQVSKLDQQAKKRNPPDYRRILNELSEIEFKLKTGAIAENYEYETAVALLL